MVKFLKGILLVLVSLQLAGCVNFTYNSYGSVRRKYIPKSFLKYKTTTTTIDTNSIYVNKEGKFFYKFYGHNKVGIIRYKGPAVANYEVNPLKAKMGYFYQEKDKLYIYLLVKTEMAKYDQSHLKIDGAGNLLHIISKDVIDVYQKQAIPAGTPYIEPDW